VPTFRSRDPYVERWFKRIPDERPKMALEQSKYGVGKRLDKKVRTQVTKQRRRKG
jgi:hypothetical protein